MWRRLVGGFLILSSIYHSKSFYEYLYAFDDDVSHMLVASRTGYTVKGVNTSLSDCTPLALGGIIGEGWQKTVYRWNDFAIKTARLDGPTYRQCLQNEQTNLCKKMLLRTMIDEISWFYRFRNNKGIVEIKSYCIPPDPISDITQLRIVVELGDLLTSLSLVQMDWNDRKHIVEQILRVVLTLKEYTLNDLRRQQFVLVSGRPKMSDLDHITKGPQNGNETYGMAACEMGSVNLTSALWLADAVAGLHGAYAHLHPYVAVALCLAGTLMNIITVIVLTRPTMISPINCLLCAIAICDIIVMSSVLVFVTHFLIVAGSRCDISDWNLGWAYFLFLHAQTSVIFHATSIWLTVLMAQIRVYTIKRATSAPTEVVTNRSTFYIAAITIIVVIVANIPNFMTFEIVERPAFGWCGDEEDETATPSPEEEQIMMYTVIASEKDCDLLKAAFWTTGILFKVVPCIMLTVSIATLVKIIRDVSHRRKTLAQVMNKKRMPRDHTTPMLVAVLSIFLVAELPQGVLHVCNAIFSKATFYEQIYQPLGDVMDLLSLLNSAVNFIIYCAMSRKFRCVFLQIVFSCLPKAIHRKYLADWSGLNENETSRRKPSAFTTDMTTKTEQLALTSSQHRMSTTSMLIQTATPRDNVSNNIKLYSNNLLSVDQPSARYLHTPRVSFDVPSKTPFANRSSLEIHEIKFPVPELKKCEKMTAPKRTYSERLSSIKNWMEKALNNNQDSPQRRINMLQCETSTVAY